MTDPWHVTRADGQSRVLVHIDPRADDGPETSWSWRDLPYHLIALGVGILAIVAYAVWHIL